MYLFRIDSLATLGQQ